MANDIIGAPELVIVKQRLFYFSPLNDYESSCLEAWLRWSSDGAISETLSEEGVEKLGTVAGSVQLLYQSIRRTEPTETVIELARFIGDDAIAANVIYDFWFELNYGNLPDVGNKEAENKSAIKNKQEGSKKDIYKLLAQHYPWASPEVVSRMTQVQQWEYLKPIVSGESDGLIFSSEAEYKKWLLKSKK